MAKILLGPTVIGIRGTVAGMTFSQNRGGPYARGWHQPPNPRTTNQLTQRVSLGQWATAWRSLSSTNQGLWNTYAADVAQELTDSLGQPYYASGLNWFINVNTYRAYKGQAQLSAAPTVAAPAAPSIEFVRFRITGAPSTSTIRITAASPTVALYNVLAVNIVNSQGVSIAPANYYIMRVAIPDGGRNITFPTQQEAKFGTTYLGQRMFFEVFGLNSDGRYGPSAFAVGDALNT